MVENGRDSSRLEEMGRAWVVDGSWVVDIQNIENKGLPKLFVAGKIPPLEHGILS
jgi:hypothetical protein